MVSSSESQNSPQNKKVSRSETGHAKNASNFDELISIALGYGATFNPSKALLKVNALQAQSVLVKSAIGAVNSASSAYSNAVAAREVAFDPLSRLSTRLLNAIKATDTTAQVDDSAQTIIRKIQGKRATPKKTDEQKQALAIEGKVVKEISTSQLSYDSRLDNFDKLLKLLASVTLYAPNENDLKVATLNALYADFKVKNAAVVNANTALSNARISRNDVMYKPSTGLVDIASDTKTYIKSIYGASSPQYKQISGLVFKTVKI